LQEQIKCSSMFRHGRWSLGILTNANGAVVDIVARLTYSELFWGNAADGDLAGNVWARDNYKRAGRVLSMLDALGGQHPLDAELRADARAIQEALKAAA
jgi:hypothetical protein